MDIRGAYINSLRGEVKKNSQGGMRRAGGFTRALSSIAVTLPDMENGSMLRDRVETGAQWRAALARVAIAHACVVSKAKKQPLI